MDVRRLVNFKAAITAKAVTLKNQLIQLESGQTEYPIEIKNTSAVTIAYVDTNGRAFMKNWYVGTSAPSSPSVGDVWVDSS